MWNSSKNTRSSGKKGGKSRSKRPLHIKRVIVEIKLIGEAAPKDAKATQARVMLNDLSPKGMGLFTSEPMSIGQEVVICFDHPKKMEIKARVISCQQHVAESHIISANPHPYRLAALFLFASQDEQTAMANLCDEVTQNYVHSAQAA